VKNSDSEKDVPGPRCRKRPRLWPAC